MVLRECVRWFSESMCDGLLKVFRRFSESLSDGFPKVFRDIGQKGLNFTNIMVSANLMVLQRFSEGFLRVCLMVFRECV